MSACKLRNISKQILCLVLSISLLSNSLFSLIEPAEAAEVIPLSDLQAGDTINFGGSEWLVLDPGTGYLYKYDLYGDPIPYIGAGGGANSPDNSNSIYYYLNDPDVVGGFYSSLSATDQGLIQNHNWTTGADGNESASSISCKVGLISYSEVEAYQSIITDLTGVSWTRTEYSGHSAFVWAADGEYFAGALNYLSSNGVRPALFLSPGTMIVGGNGGTVYQDVDNTTTDITDLVFDGQVSSVVDAADHTITCHLPYGTNLSSLAPMIELSLGASVSPASGAPVDFSSGSAIYRVTALNGTTTQDWTVNCLVDLNTATDFTAFSLSGVNGTINSNAHTVSVNLPYASEVSNLAATFSLSDGATIEAGAAPQISGVTSNDFTDSITYTITAQDGITQQEWTVTCNVLANSSNDFTAYSIAGVAGVIDADEGTVTVTLPYGTAKTNLIATYSLSAGASVKILSPEAILLAQTSGVSANNFTWSRDYYITAENNTDVKHWTVSVIVSLNTGTNITAYSAETELGVVTNGVIDSDAHTVSLNFPYGSNLIALYKITYSLSGDATLEYNDEFFGFNNIGSWWHMNFTNPLTHTVIAHDGINQQDWTVNSVINSNTATDITNFSLAGMDGIIDSNAHTVVVNVLHDTNVTALIASFNLSAGASAKVNNTSQTSDVTGNDFTNPLTYTVTAEDGTTQQNWTVTCVVNSDTANDITSFSLAGVSGTLDNDAHTVMVELPHNTDVSNLAATFSLSAGASVKINNTSQTSGVTSNDFTNPLTYTVTAEDGTTQQDWTVTCVINSSAANAITSFSLSGVNGTIDSNAHTVSVNVPHDVNISNFVASFSLSAGASAKINNTSQTSGVTSNDFSNPVTYTVTAEDGTTQQDWTVTCINNPPEDPSINPDGGSFDNTVNVSITGIDNGCTAYYTTNGASPKLSGIEYTVPFVVEASSTVKASTYDPNINKWSNIVSEAYTIDIPAVEYTLSLSVNNQAGGTTGGSGLYAQGNPVTVTANAANGYSFRNWTENGNEVSTSASYSFNMGAFNRTLVANFTAITSSGGGSGGGSPPPAPPALPPVEEPLLPVEIPEAPIVITGSASLVTMSQATLNGQIESIGGKQCKQVNFAYRQKGTSDWLYTTAVSGSFGNGARFSANLSGLKANAVYDYKARAYNTFGWGEGLVYQFTAVPENLPKVSTEAAINLEVAAATLEGTIIGTGGLPITESGFLWGTSLNILKKAKATADLDGSLSFLLSGLKKNTLYYYRAYATNAAGIGYGDFLSFQTLEKPLLVVTTQTATNIGSDAAVINGSYTGGAGANISTAFMLGTETDTGKYSRLSSDITNSDGTFSKVLNGLQPNTTYYYQALASNIYNDFTVLPGDFMSFTTLPPNMPEVETKNPSGVTSSSVNLSGIVLKNNGLAVIETGFLWGTDPNPENKVVAPTGSDGRNFSYPLSGLKGGTSYNIKAYASNSVGTGYGKVISFNTPARIPALSTTAADFNADSWQVNFTGNIEDTGGALLTEYGFRYSTDQQKWIPLIIDRGSLTGRIAAQLNGLNQLPTGIYYVQAYGVNPMGTGYGNTVSFATPVIPKLVASVEGLGFDSAVLIGNITDTGNKGLPCQNIQFQYRPIGETQWQTVGSEQGLFGPGLFRLNLAGLKPGTKYEFIAQAYNPAGWGSSQVVPFFTGWGLTDKDAAFNMKGAGYNSTDTANVLKRDYRDDDVAAFSALEYATFTINDIAVGLRDSDYKESRQALVNLLKSANYEVVPVAMIIKQIFPETPAPSYYFSGGNVFTIPGKADLTYKWAAECLKNAGYGIDEIIKAMKEVFAYKAIDCVNNLQSDKLALQPYAIYGAIARAYGINDLANCIWSIESKELQRGSPIYRPLAGVLKALTKGAGITGLQAATLLKEVYPPTNAPQMAGAYKNAGFTALEAGEALMQIFGTDSQALALALAKNDYGSYGLKEIEDFLFTKMNCTPKEMVQIVTIIARNSMVRAYDEVPRVLTDYYKLDAYAAAKAMYTGGWNEANDGTGYGLTNMIRILNDYYGLKTAGSIIAVLKELGLSPIAVANVVWTKYQNWLSDYREQGYSATDAAAWCKSTGTSYYGNVHSAVSIMAQGKYSLIDIVLGIRNIYEPDAGTALEIFREASSSRQLGWTSSTIASAVSQVYKVDPIPAVIKAMRASGAHVNQTTSTLKDSFAMDDRIKVAEYLSQGGYSENEVLSAFNYVFDKNSSNRQAIESLLMLDDKVFHSKPPNMGAVLSAMGCLNPLGAASLLNKNGYTIKEIAQAIKTSYTVTSFKAIEDMTRALGSDKQKEIMSAVMAVYGLDPVSYIQYRKGMGNNAIQAAESLIAFLGATEPEKLASYLAQAKYEEKDVLSAILKIFYQGAANPDALQMLTKIMQEIYRQNKAIIETILMAAGISSPEAAINVLYQAGYSLDVIVRELKDSYNLTAGEATDLLIRSGYYQQSDINAKIQTIFGGDIVLVSLQYWMSRGYYASSSFRLLADEMGIKDSAKRFDYLLKAGYPENDAWEAVIQNAREDMVYILKENYKLKEPAKIGKQFKSLPILGIYYGVFNVIPQLQRVFPGIKSIDVLKVLFAAELNHREIVGWLRGDQENGLPDDELISILGTAKPDDLGLRTVDAVEIIHGKGYSLKDAAAWLLKDKYTWPDFFGYLVNNYSPGIRGSSASNVSPVLNELKKYYSIDDLASGLIGSLCRMSGRSVPDTQIYANVYREMRDIGLSLEDTVAVLLRTGEKSASALVRIMADDSIGRANAEHNPSLRLSATDIANVLYNTVLKTPGVSISMIDIAAGLVEAGPNAGSFAYFPRLEVLGAMKSITGKYLQSTGSSVPVDIAALYMLREAGLSSDEAAAMMADDRVGLSLGSVVKAMFGLGNDWMEAVENLAGAGYSFTDSISAVFNNHDYHNIIGISILSTLVTKAVTILDDSNKIKNLISIMKMVGKGGFRLSSRIN